MKGLRLIAEGLAVVVESVRAGQQAGRVVEDVALNAESAGSGRSGIAGCAGRGAGVAA